MNVQQTIQQARAELDAGNDKKAVQLLTGTVFEADNLEQVRDIRELAVTGRAMASPFRRLRWSDIVRLADLRVSKAA